MVLVGTAVEAGAGKHQVLLERAFPRFYKQPWNEMDWINLPLPAVLEGEVRGNSSAELLSRIETVMRRSDLLPFAHSSSSPGMSPDGPISLVAEEQKQLRAGRGESIFVRPDVIAITIVVSLLLFVTGLALFWHETTLSWILIGVIFAGVSIGGLFVRPSRTLVARVSISPKYEGSVEIGRRSDRVFRVRVETGAARTYRELLAPHQPRMLLEIQPSPLLSETGSRLLGTIIAHPVSPH